MGCLHHACSAATSDPDWSRSVSVISCCWFLIRSSNHLQPLFCLIQLPWPLTHMMATQTLQCCCRVKMKMCRLKSRDRRTPLTLLSLPAHCFCSYLPLQETDRCDHLRLQQNVQIFAKVKLVFLALPLATEFWSLHCQNRIPWSRREL